MVGPRQPQDSRIYYSLTICRSSNGRQLLKLVAKPLTTSCLLLKKRVEIIHVFVHPRVPALPGVKDQIAEDRELRQHRGASAALAFG